MEDEERIAPEGKTWVCLACGKTSKDLYGLEFPEETSGMWDESCMLNARLFEKDKLVFDVDTGRVSEIKK